MSLLDVRGLRVSYDNADAVKDLSFTLQAGETLALVGESGCGKSTTALALMALLDIPNLRTKAMGEARRVVARVLAGAAQLGLSGVGPDHAGQRRRRTGRVPSALLRGGPWGRVIGGAHSGVRSRRAGAATARNSSPRACR